MAKSQNTKGKYKKPKPHQSVSSTHPDPNKPNASPIAPLLPILNNNGARWPIYDDPNELTADFRLWFVCNYKQLEGVNKNQYLPDKLVPGQGLHRMSNRRQWLAPFPPAVDLKHYSKETIDSWPVLENLVLDDVEQVLMSLMTSTSLWERTGQTAPLFHPDLGLSSSEQAMAVKHQEDFKKAFRLGDVERMMKSAVSFAQLLMEHEFVNRTSIYWINITNGRAWWDQATSLPEIKKEGQYFYVLVNQDLRKSTLRTRGPTRALLQAAQAKAKLKAANNVVDMDIVVDRLGASGVNDRQGPGDPSVQVDSEGGGGEDDESEEELEEEEENEDDTF